MTNQSHMNRITFMTCLLAAIALHCQAQSKPLRIVFDVTSQDTLVHQATIRHVSGEAKDHPDGKFEVVIYGNALNMLLKDKSSVSAGVQQLAAMNNVSFKVCSATMKRHHADKGQLIPGVQIVQDGIVEIMDRQGEGWGYIKETP